MMRSIFMRSNLGHWRFDGNGRSAAHLRAVPILLLSLSVAGCGMDRADYEETWDDYADRPWVGPNLWANRLQDWQVRDGRLESISSQPMRTAHLLTARVGPGDGTLALEVRLGILGDGVSQGSTSARGSAGLLVGSGVGLDYRSAALVHHSWGPGGGLFAGIDGAGRLFVRDFETEADWLARGDDHSERVD
jgi:alkaline phosphatase D